MGCLPSRHLRRASSSGLRIAPDGRCAGAGPVDLLVVVSGYGYLRHADRPNARILARLARTAQSVLGADTAAWLLAAAGLLRDGRATVHWQSPSDLAARAGLSMRSLNRLVLTQLGMPPGRYYQLLRLSRARELAVKTDLDLAEIVLRCGLAGASSRSKSLSNAYGYAIGKTRRAGHQRQRGRVAIGRDAGGHREGGAGADR